MPDSCGRSRAPPGCRHRASWHCRCRCCALGAALARALPGLPRIEPAELRRLLEDKAFDIGAMQRELGVAPIALAEGLARSFAAQNDSGAPSRRIASASGV